MARTRTRTAVPIEEPEADAPALPLAPEPPEEPTTWSDLIDELDGEQETEILVYAEPERGQGGAAWCFSCTPDDYPRFSDLLTRIKADPEMGPGRYSLRMKRGNKFAGRKTITIAGRRRPPGELVPTAPAPTSSPAPQESRHAEFLEKMVLALLNRAPTAAAAGPALSDIIPLVKLLTPEKTDFFGELTKLLEVKKLIGGEGDAPAGDGDDWLAATVKTFGPAIAGALQQPATPAPAPGQLAPPTDAAQLTPPPRPTIKPNPAPAPNPQPKKPQTMNPLAMLKPLLSLLLKGARNGSTPDSYAELAIDQLGNFAPTVLAVPDLQTRLEQIAPASREHREWFGELIEIARDMIAPPESDDPDADGAGDLTSAQTAPDVPGHVPGESAPAPE